MKILIFIGLMILGVIAYYILSSIKYIVSGRFMFYKWYKENFAFYIWGCVVCVVLGLIYAVSPDSVVLVLSHFGIDISSPGGQPLPPVVVGLMLAAGSRRIAKPIKQDQPTAQPAPADVLEAEQNPN